jgi:hypothetical protein
MAACALLAVACGSPPPAAAPRAVAGAPVAGVRTGVIVMRRWREPVERVVIEPGGIWVGPEGEPLAHYLFPSRTRLQDLSWFVRSYGRFHVARDGGELAFGGKGPAAPNAAEQRMIAEWARSAVAEVTARHSSETYGLAFVWHRGGSVGNCEDVAVYLSGEVRASACSWSREVCGRLSPDQVARVYAWIDNLAPFQDGGEEGGQNGDPARLVFGGQGRKEPRREQLAEMRGFAQSLHREMAPPSAVQAAAPGNAASPSALLPSPSQVPSGRQLPSGEQQGPFAGQRLLVGPETVGGRPVAAIPPKLQPPPGSPAPKRPSPPAPLPPPLTPTPDEGRKPPPS